jgi:2',3'-cyclic-nucleotide 2'-phosphodiesterase/3'-nucleotidase
MAEVGLRILATTDLHMNILPYDYVADAPSPRHGLAHTARLIHQARAEVANTLLLDNGDFLHGSPVADVLAQAGGDDGARGLHPIIAAMRALGYDAVTLGNHDFDHGAVYLGQVLVKAPFAVVCSNLTIHATDRPTLPFATPFTLLHRRLVGPDGHSHAICIGVLGFLPPGVLPGLEGTGHEIRDIVETARQMVPQLRAMGADLVIALAHSGIGAATHRKGMENAVVPLTRVEGIDAIVAGHDHGVFPRADALPHVLPAGADTGQGKIHGIPVVAPGFWGSHLGVIDLRLIPHGPGRWQVTRTSAHVRSVRHAGTAPASPAPAIARTLDRAHAKTRDALRQPVGQTRRRLHSYFATLAPSPAVDIVQRASAWFAARALTGTPDAGFPILASAAPFKCGGLAGPDNFTDLGPGPITRAALSELYPYPNTLCAVRLSGAALADWLERAASVFNRTQPGAATRLFHRDLPAYTAEGVAGVDYRVDLGQPARFAPDGTLRDPSARRIGGLSLAHDDMAVLVTNSFRLTRGGLYPGFDPAQVVIAPETPMREVIAAWLRVNGPYDSDPWATWRLAAPEGARLDLLAAPMASEVMADIAVPGITAGQIGTDGFRHFRVTL